MIDYSLNYYTLIYAISVLITGFLILISWKRRSNKIGASFFYLNLFFFYWSFIAMIETSIINVDLKIILSKFDYIGSVGVPVLFFVFSLYYNKLDHWLKPRNVFLLLFFPIITLFLVFTNEYHGLVWSSYYVSEFTVGLVHPIIYEYGCWFWFFHLGYSYILLLVGFVLFFDKFLKLKKPQSYQVGVILIGVLLPFLSNIIYVLGLHGLPGLDITRVATSLTGILFVVSIFYWKFLDIIPIARSLLIEKMSDGLVVIDKYDRIVDINPSATNLLSFKKKESLLGVEITKILKRNKNFEEVLIMSRESKSNLKQHISIGGSEVDLSIEQLFDNKGCYYGRLLVFRDVTEIRLVEDKLKKEKEMARNYLDVAKVILLALDKDGNVLMINKKGLEISGFERNEILGKNWFRTCLPENIQESVLSFFKKLVSGKIKNMEESFENEIISRDGKKLLIAWHSTLIKDDDGKIIGTLSSGEDITQRRLDEEIIKKNSEKLSRLLHHLRLATEAAQIGIWDLNLKNNSLIWDDQMYSLYDVDPKKFDNTYDFWRKSCHPEDLARVEEEIHSAVLNKTNFNSTFRIILPDKSIRYLRSFANVIYDKKNNPHRIVGVNFDITEEKEVDRAKSEFVSLASHQLRTPLTTINWYTEMLLNEDGGKISEEQRSYLEEIHVSNRHMVELVSSLLNVSRIELGSLMVNPININLLNLIEEIVKFHKVIISSKKIKFSYKVSKKVPVEFLADKKLLGIVFQNILSNSINYTPDRGSISLSLNLDKSEKNIIFKVSDSGYGIPKSQQSKIFTKLFRADNAQKIDTNGTGLGLYIVKSIIDKSGGKVWFESIEGKGTTFYISLPIEGMKKIEGTKSLL